MLRFDRLKFFFDQVADAGRFGPQVGEATESFHPRRIGCLGAVVFVFELRGEGVGHELPQADAAERRPSLGEPKEVVRDVDRCFQAENRSRKYGTVNAFLRVAMLENSPANGTSVTIFELMSGL